VPYANWPLRLIGAHLLPDDQRLGVQADFHDDAYCNLDESFSEWYRASLQTKEDMDSPANRSLVATAAKQFWTTNMNLESLLQRFKYSVVTSRRKPSAERLAYSGLLSQLRQDFDSSCDVATGVRAKRSALVKAGVPLVSAPSSDPQRRRYSRPDARWRNKRWNAWRRAHPNALPEIHREAFAAIVAEWKRMSAEERQAAELEMLREQPAIGDEENVDDEDDENLELQKQVRSYHACAWNTFGDESPMRGEVMQNFLRSLRSETSNHSMRRGIASLASKLRWDNRDRMIAFDEGLIKEEDVFRKRFACWEAHPGLCVTLDAVIYEKTIRMAQNFERFFTEPMRRRCYSFDFSTSALPLENLTVYFGVKRGRTPYSRATHFFGEVVREFEPSRDGKERWTFASDPRAGALRKLRVLNQWTLAKALLQRDAKQISITNLLHESIKGEGTVSLKKVGVGFDIWPGEYKPPAAPREPREATSVVVIVFTSIRK
jgi:hypothetical protein